jgi:hypothetical protein
VNLFYCGELRPTDGWGELGWTGLGQIGGERWRDGWMDGWMQEQGDDDGRSRGLSQGYGGGWQKIQLGAEGRWAVGASVASGAVVQWCPAGCCWCSGAVRMDVVDDGSDTW